MVLEAQQKVNSNSMPNDFKAPDNIKKFIRKYVGLLLCSKDIDFLSTGGINPDMIPSDMLDERNILRAVIECVKERMPALEVYVKAKLETNNWKVSEGAVEKIRADVGDEWVVDTKNSIHLCASIIRQWYLESGRAQAWANHANGVGLKNQKGNAVTPPVNGATIMDDMQLLDNGIRTYEQKRKYFIEHGRSPNPVPHLSSLRNKGIVFFDGEYSLLLGNEGTGKSSFAQQLAENIAWVQGGYNVAYISLETNPEKLAYRTLSRNLGIPLDDFIKYKVDTSSKEYKSVYENFMQKRIRAEDENGMVFYVTLNEKTTVGIIDAIYQCYFMSLSAGRKLFVIVDHVGRIEKPRAYGSNDATAITEAIVSISNACSSIGSHVMFLGHTDNIQGKRLFGASQANKNAQIVLVLSSDVPEGGVKTTIPSLDYLGRHMADYMGRPRFIQRVGAAHSGIVKIEIVKSSDSEIGYVDVYCERPMGNIFTDIPS